MRIKIKVDGQEHQVDVDQEVKIDEDNLQRCMVEQPSKFAWLATALAVYESELKRLEDALEDKEFQLYDMYKDMFEKQPDGPKVTERLLSSRIHANKDYITLREELYRSSEIKRRLTAAVKAMEHRKEMITELSRLKRGEMRLDASGY